MVRAGLILLPPEFNKYSDNNGIKGTSDFILEIIKLFTSFKSSWIRLVIRSSGLIKETLEFPRLLFLFLKSKFCNLIPDMPIYII